MSEPVAKRTDAAFRVIEAAPDKLYAALTDADAVAAWLPPKGMTGHVEVFEARVGGAYRMTLRHDDAGAEMPGKSSENPNVVEGRFVTLLPGKRVAQQVKFDSSDPGFAGTMTITWRLDPVPEGTRVTVTCEDVPVGIRRKDHLAGLRSTLGNLARYAE